MHVKRCLFTGLSLSLHMYMFFSSSIYSNVRSVTHLAIDIFLACELIDIRSDGLDP